MNIAGQVLDGDSSGRLSSREFCDAIKKLVQLGNITLGLLHLTVFQAVNDDEFDEYHESGQYYSLNTQL